MAIGSIGVYFIAILANNNDQTAAQKQQTDYAKQVEEMRKARKASSKPLDGYAAQSFDAASVTELKTEDLVEGTGNVVAEGANIEANYFGWTADGQIFDSSNQNGTVAPLTFGLSGVIQGWSKGLVGMKEGGVRKLTIPSDMAYGPNAAANSQPAGPLMFIVQLVSIKADTTAATQ